MQEDKVTIRDLEKYTKELTRKHLRKHGLRVFEHPTFTGAIIVVKNNDIIGMTNRKILSDNAHTQNIIMFNSYYEFEL